MAVRVRGHYRIDARGRLVPMADVNDPGVTYATPLPRLRYPPLIERGLPSRRRMIEWAVVICVIAISAGLLVTIIPKVQRAAFAAQAAQAAAQRAALVQSLSAKNNPPSR